MSRLVVLARVDGRQVAFDCASVEAVIDIAVVTPVPFAPVHVIGLSTVRSQVVTVIDAGLAVGAARCNATGRAVMVASGGHRYAIRVDAVDDAIMTPDPVDSGLSGRPSGWALAAIGRIDLGECFALLLDVDALVAGSDGINQTHTRWGYPRMPANEKVIP